ncbi:MAG: hypothetical protein ACRC41_02925 [Sarcina sp.]
MMIITTTTTTIITIIVTITIIIIIIIIITIIIIIMLGSKQGSELDVSPNERGTKALSDFRDVSMNEAEQVGRGPRRRSPALRPQDSAGSPGLLPL